MSTSERICKLIPRGFGALVEELANLEQKIAHLQTLLNAEVHLRQATERDRDYLEARTHAALRWAGVRHLGGGLFQRADGARWLLRGCTDDPHEGCPIPPDPAFVPEEE